MRPATLAFAVLLAAQDISRAAPGGGGFPAGDVLLYSPAVQGSSSVDGAIVRIDVTTGQVTLLVDLIQTLQDNGAICYDPFRDRVLFCGGFTAVGQPPKLYSVDVSGSAQEIGYSNQTLSAMAPASGGRIYLHNTTVGAAPIQYLDAGNVMHPLLDAAGAQPYVPAGLGSLRCMAYDAGTNALFLAQANGVSATCAGGSSDNLTVRRVPLSADGSRILGMEDCTQPIVDPGGGNHPVGWSRAPGGKLILVVDTGSNAQEPRMQLFDPVTLVFTPFASNGHAGAASIEAGTWSSVLGKTVILDTLNNVLRAYAQGEVGPGSVITPSMLISSPGGSGETATLIEVTPGECGSNVGFYCTAKTTSGGCQPTLATSGSPSASAPSPFLIQAAQIEPQKVGILFYGESGGAAIPFHGAFLCVKPPIIRTAGQNSGGGAACSGSFQFDFNAYVASGADPSLSAGSVVNGQFWFRDPAEPISGTGLSAGVVFTLCP